ncbi:MAG TPA: zinc-dependent metalloprotease [Nocardioidaceae bacterium]|nr:zinc-dependent metalloprotease [Nocardioidaceae bacterium]
MSEPAMIDWDFAVQTARRLIRPGPYLSGDEMHAVVDSLRTSSATAEEHVRELTLLDASTGSSPVLVVDRAGWVAANADGFSRVVQPLVEKVEAQRNSIAGMVGAFGSRVTGAEAGALLAFLSHKVLGQFDPFGGDAARRGDSPGRLLLVAPNIVAAEQEMEVDADDFRLWVCLHEEAHRVQFTAVPWLRDHLLAEIGAFVAATDVDPERLRGMMTESVQRLTELVRGDSGTSVLDLFTSAEQRTIIDRVTAVMSLLEGHADVVMDGVGTSVVPSVGKIRSRFDRRRKGRGPSDRLLRRLLGLEAKMRQYADGAAFVNGVVDRVGMTGFNAVWTGPEQLPTAAEIGDPAAWVTRVHG